MIIKPPCPSLSCRASGLSLCGGVKYSYIRVRKIYIAHIAALSIHDYGISERCCALRYSTHHCMLLHSFYSSCMKSICTITVTFCPANDIQIRIIEEKFRRFDHYGATFQLHRRDERFTRKNQNSLGTNIFRFPSEATRPSQIFRRLLQHPNTD